MLVTFRCEAHASITMFEDVAQTLIKMMGLSGAIPSAILAEDVPAAIDCLRNAITQTESIELSSPGDQHDTWKETKISLNHRAMPLIEMLTAASKRQCNVLWEYARTLEPVINL